MAKSKFSYKSFMLIAVLFISCLLTSFMGLSHNFVFADMRVYSNVLTDLQRDENFDINKYPVKEDDYSLKVIQIAESSNNELFVYVYQPCSPNEDLKATTINISTNEGLYFVNYSLTLLSKYETLYKYLVNGFTISNDEIRYYDIPSIFRFWNKNYDSAVEENNTSSEISFRVAQQWIVSNIDGDLKYDCLQIDVVEITDKYVGFVRYEGGYSWDGITYNSCDNHFVAFSTDHNIDRLLEADVYYKTQSYYYKNVESMTALTSPTIKYGEIIEEEPAHLTYTDKQSYQGSWFRKKYTWDKITSVEKFLELEKEREHVYHVELVGDVRKVSKLTEEGLSEIQNKQWVLRFATTDYSYKKYGSSGVTDVITEVSSTNVMDVSILRLKFENDGVTYNLGVVDNKQTGDGKPDNETKTEFKLAGWLQNIIDWFKGFNTALQVIFWICVGLIGLGLIAFIAKIIKLIYETLFK